jgi:hypothetical protein
MLLLLLTLLPTRARRATLCEWGYWAMVPQAALPSLARHLLRAVAQLPRRRCARRRAS